MYAALSFVVWMGTNFLFVIASVSSLVFGDQFNVFEYLENSYMDVMQIMNIWDETGRWLWSKHHEFEHTLSRELKGLRGKDGVGWMLVLISFLYGILHAAGPGHGKVVLTTYLLTHRHQLNRGVAMGITAALLQGITALLLVYGLVGIAGWLPNETKIASLWAARLSFILIAIVGLYLLIRASGVLFRTVRQMRHDAQHSHLDHDAHSHAHSDSCGCNHLPSINQIESGNSRHAFLGVVLSIGLRPCSGAVLVLVSSTALQVMWHGALAVFAMSVGTAITIVLLAFLAVKARELASTVVAMQSPLWTLAGAAVGVIGGGLLLLLGLWLINSPSVLNTHRLFT